MSESSGGKKRAYSEGRLREMAKSDLPLLQQICDSDEVTAATRVFAIEALGCAGRLSDVDAQLVRYLESPRPIFRESALHAIGDTLSSRLLTAIEQIAADNESSDLREIASEILSEQLEIVTCLPGQYQT